VFAEAVIAAMVGPTTTANIARSATGPDGTIYPLFSGQFVREKGRKKGRKERGIPMVARSRVRPLMQSIFRDAVSRTRLFERRADEPFDYDAHYLAIELHPHAQNALKQFVPDEKGLSSDVGSGLRHHITVAYDGLYAAHPLLKYVGDNISAHVTRVHTGPGLTAVAVEPHGNRARKVLAAKEHPHVTVAFDSARARPEHSNALLAQTSGRRLTKPIHINGTVRLLPKPT
jgi:hypothetical protein